MVKKIISGGQTGADRAGLNVAIELDIPHGGWAPKGFMAEDGRVPEFYNLKEYTIPGYPARTEQNVLDSDGTVVFSFGKPAPDSGSGLTVKLARRHKKPVLHINLSAPKVYEAKKLIMWLQDNNIGVLNVAGSRASDSPMVGRGQPGSQSVGHCTHLILKAALLILRMKTTRLHPHQEAPAS